MATFKASVQDHHKKSDGSYNVKIRVTHQRKTRYLATATFVHKEDMTKSLRIKDQDTIEKLEAQIRIYYNDIKELGGAIGHLDVDDIVKFIQQKNRKRFESENPNVNFYSYVDTLVDKMIADNRKSSAGSYKAMKQSLIRFYGDTLYFSDINVRFLEVYESHMRKNQDTIGVRGIYLYLSLVRAVFNFAIKELNDYESGIVKIKGSPFVKYEMPENSNPRKRAIPIEKIRELGSLPDVKFKRVNMARDVFMLSFYLCGMNSVDLYSCNLSDDGRIVYFRQKTRRKRKDKAKMSVLIPEVAKELFEKYKDPLGTRAFIFYRMYTTYKTFNNAVNIGLDSIGNSVQLDSLQYYAARHSFATIARNNCKLPMDYVSQALNHSLPQFETTDTYIAEDWSLVDEVQEKVINKLFELGKLQIL